MGKATKVLYLEDEWSLGRIVKESLTSRGYNLKLIDNGSEFMTAFHQFQPNICLLDVMVPNIDGLTIGEMVREANQKMPIIFLTAKSQSSDVLKGFKSGGNDYIKKPFSMEELIVRIYNLVNRTETQKTAEVLELGNYTFNFPKQQLQYKSEIAIQLTHREAHLLFHLLKNKNQVLDRSIILNKLWGTDDFFSARSMDVFISKLRKKLKQDHTLKIINVRGFGYKLTV